MARRSLRVQAGGTPGSRRKKVSSGVLWFDYDQDMRGLSFRAFLLLVAAQMVGERQASANDPQVSACPSARHDCSVGTARAMAELPAHVPAAEGKVTLWADFGAADKGGHVPLYLINQTDEARSFDSQDGDVYIKLEFKDEGGSWRRAEAHLSSWCGNSYFPMMLTPRSFFTLAGYRAEADKAPGRRQKVRYAMQGQPVISNEGMGWVRQDDLDAVALDVITAAEIPREITRKLNHDFNSAESEGKAMAALRDLAWYPRNEPAVRRVSSLREHAATLPATDKLRELIKAIDNFLANLDTPRPTGEKLALQCIARIVQDPAADPTMSERSAWELLKAPSEPQTGGGVLHQAETWRGVVMRALELVKDEEREQARLGAQTREGFGGPFLPEDKIAPPAANRLLATPWLVDALLMDAEVESWVASGGERLRAVGMEALMRRDLPDRLVAMVWERPGVVQIDVLRVLARVGLDVPQRLPQPGSEEHRFWEYCAKQMPVETAIALRAYAPEAAFQRLLHASLRGFFQQGESGEERTQGYLVDDDGYRFSAALKVLASWKREEDTPLLQALLKNDGFIMKDHMEGDENVVTKHYVLRAAARQALMERGQREPKNLVLEEEGSRYKLTPPTPLVEP